MCRRFFLSVVGAAMTAVLASTGWAQVADPPVPQNIGQVDTEAGELTEADCRVCHDAAQGVPDRHHMNYGQPISGSSVVPFPDADGDGNDDTTYGCLNCHDPNFTVVRDCTACHSVSPHHRTQAATDRQCTTCHGDLVDNYDDGHYIPSYAPSMVTPYTGLWYDGYYPDGSPETQNTGEGVLDTPAGNYPGEAGRGDTHASDANRVGLILESTGTDNNIHIDYGGRYDTTTFTVVVAHQVGISPPTAAWSAGGGDGGTLTITFDPGVTTANEMIAVIEDEHGTPGTNEFFAEPDHTQGEGTGLFEPEHYEPEGGLPLNSYGYPAGGCNYCHDAENPAGLIVDNHDTHHGIELGIGTSSDVKAGTPDDPNPGGTWRKCNCCHDYTDRGGSYHDNGGATFAMHIRICEECHGPDSLHAIQADSPNAANIGTIVVGGEDAGYGHHGRDAGAGDSDCWGCHGFPNATSAPLVGPLVPNIHNADVQVITAGSETTLTLTGATFTNESAGVTFESDVVLTGPDGTSLTLTPTSITAQEIQVTIPADVAPGNYTVQAVKVDTANDNEEVASNPTVVTIVPEVKIDQATAAGKVTITGSGFGGYGEGSGTSVTRSRTWGWGRWARTAAVEGKVISWSDDQIVVDFGSAPKAVTVNSIYGSDSAKAVSTNTATRAVVASRPALFGGATVTKAAKTTKKRPARAGWWWW